jgi:hypothetical protein
LKNISWDNVFVAGGAILGCLSANQDGYRSSDIDLFIYGIDDEHTANEKVRDAGLVANWRSLFLYFDFISFPLEFYFDFFLILIYFRRSLASLFRFVLIYSHSLVAIVVSANSDQYRRQGGGDSY